VLRINTFYVFTPNNYPLLRNWAQYLSLCVARMGQLNRVLVGKPEGRRPLGRPRRRWEDGIRMDLEEIG
jgi:hypothetical protein